MSDFNARSVAYEVLKCFSNKFFSNKLVAMKLLEDTTAKLIDDVFLLLHAHTRDKRDPEKTTKNLIKISVKIGMLQRGGKFSLEEKDSLLLVQVNLKTVVKTLITFYQVDHTYDRSFLIKYLTELETLLTNLISPHLTEKSVGRVEQIFGVVKTEEFLDQIYQPKWFVLYPEMRQLMGQVVDDLIACLDAGTI
eukprot:GFUD01000490.1.p1 GENE.GFUD01000490.1~~GFUD01000490.1.p1  ORF type:complete len:193 (-),score=46.73 GFUD01000490.1:228-806(-)